MARAGKESSIIYDAYKPVLPLLPNMSWMDVMGLQDVAALILLEAH
jgi:hypothetical protein